MNTMPARSCRMVLAWVSIRLWWVGTKCNGFVYTLFNIASRGPIVAMLQWSSLDLGSCPMYWYTFWNRGEQVWVSCIRSLDSECTVVFQIGFSGPGYNLGRSNLSLWSNSSHSLYLWIWCVHQFGPELDHRDRLKRPQPELGLEKPI